jgi:hypothetical protein
MTGRIPLRRPLVALAALAAAALGVALIPSGPAQAQDAARVESTTRPNFGILLDPPSRSASRRTSHRRWTQPNHRPGPPDHRPLPGPGGQEEVVLVDCGGNPGTGAIETAVRRVRPGGTLIIRARGGPCVGWLNVDKPMTILGEGGFDPRDWDRNPGVTLQAPDGLPCITVAAGVTVSIRDVVFASPNAGDAACVVGYNAQIEMNRVGFRHVGDEAAIYMDGGLLDIRNAVVDAQTVAPAIVADGASLTAYEIAVFGASVGMELTPGAGQTATISTSTIKGTGVPNAFGPRSIGMIIRSGRDYGRVEITNTAIGGFIEGVAIEGASVKIDDSRIFRTEKGVVLYNGELTLNRSRIRAASVGVAAASGRAVITDNMISGVREEVIYEESRSSVEASGNLVWSRYLCQARFRERSRGRYEPYWTGDGNRWKCAYGPYPRDWWDDEEGLLGLDYVDDGYTLEGYDTYQQGWGHWVRNGQGYVYVPDRSRYGDDRWIEDRGRRR